MRKYCNSVGGTISVGEMGGDRRDRGYPVLTNGDQTAVSNIGF